MAAKWPYRRVEEVTLKVAMGPFGSSIKVETFTDAGIPVISGQHLREAELTDGEFNFITEAHADSLKNANVQRGDVVFTHAGNIGQVAFIPDSSAYQRYVISQRQFYLRCNTNLILPEFITYYFKTAEGQHRLLANATQVGVPSIARPSSYLKTIEVPVPSVDDQKTVVQNIRALDAKIRSNSAINQTLEAMAQAIFKSWFVDFDPIKAKIAAKLEGRDPLRAAISAICGKPDAELDALPPEQYDRLSTTAALFPDEMEASALGDIPKGWSQQALAQLADKIGSGSTPRGGKEVYLEEGVALIRSQNVYDSLFVWEGLARISDEAAIQLKGVTVQEDDVLLNITGASILRTCVVEPDALPARVNQHVAIIRAKAGVPPRFIHMHLLRPDIKSYLLGLNAGASREAITKTHIESLVLLIPGPELLAAFQTVTAPLFRQVQRFAQQMRVLGELRDTLLPKLLSGELSVSSTTAEVEA